MHEFKNILVPDDGSEVSSRAVDKAVALAKISGGVVEVKSILVCKFLGYHFVVNHPA